MTFSKSLVITENNYKRKRPKGYDSNAARTRRESGPMAFVGVDGEGMTLPDGSHGYVLLGVGDQQLVNPEGLTWQECFRFLYDQFLTYPRKTAFCGFFLSYDFMQMFKTLPEAEARLLLTKTGRAQRARASKNMAHVGPWPVKHEDWEFDILGNKRLKIRPRSCYCAKGSHNPARCPPNPNRWMNICDAGPFFQKSFLKVINPAEWSEPIVTQEEYEEIEREKGRRGSALLDAAMLHYNAAENRILSTVLERLDAGFRELGIKLNPGQWYGPGAAAQAWLNTRLPNLQELKCLKTIPTSLILHRPLRSAEIAALIATDNAGAAQSMVDAWNAGTRATPTALTLPDGISEECIPWEAARESYFGGWFEIMAHGIVQGTTYEYDVNSAYPYIISTLPCLEHGKWVHNDPDCRWETPYTLVCARVRGYDTYIGAMSHRDEKGNIYRPHRTEGWYWLHELYAARKAGLIGNDTDDDGIDVLDSWTYHPCSCPPPLREVRDIYALRKEVGKKTPLGIACKLVPNSLYGKFAQSIGQPKFANPVYASLITAGCRTMILNAIATHPKRSESVLMVATDGVYFTEPHPGLPVSESLGDWDLDKKENLCLFKPGVYWDDKTHAAIADGLSPVFKSRGVNAKYFGRHLKQIDKDWKHFRESLQTLRSFGLKGAVKWPEVKFVIDFAMVTPLQALLRNKWELAGTQIKPEDNEVIQSANAIRKRTGFYAEKDTFLSGGRIIRGRIRSHPRENDPYVPSCPYDKRFGMDSEENQLTNVTDIEQFGISPEGYPVNNFFRALGIQ